MSKQSCKEASIKSKFHFIFNHFSYFPETTGDNKSEVNGNKPAGGSVKNTKCKNKSSTKNFTSDAILSCPACLTTLCIDCQRYGTVISEIFITHIKLLQKRVCLYYFLHILFCYFICILIFYIILNFSFPLFYS